ncbi:MAG: glycosidase [Bacteroidetes bacterium]|nr:MAG: glycosidase [Bacteroidota bacterium]
MDIAKRFSQNPLLSPKDVQPSNDEMIIECLLNPGVFKYEGKIWLLIRVAERPEQKDEKISFPVLDEGRGVKILSFDKNDPDLDDTDPRVIKYKGEFFLTTMSHLRLMSSSNGIDFKEEKGFSPIYGEGKLEAYGIEDCRVATFEGLYHLTYTQVSGIGVGVGYIQTKDWRSFDRKGMIFSPHNKDSTLFEEKINGKYYALHRPSSPELGGNYIWLAESEDLLHWGNHKCIAITRPDNWDSARVGAGASPIKTEAGWLEIYHGANSDNRYCLGAILLDLDDPSKVIARSDDPIMEPLMDYEKTGFFGNVVFTNGHVVNGDTITIYYGASDEVICGATFSIKEILKTLENNKLSL